jgi:predicted dehydrogenase
MKKQINYIKAGIVGCGHLGQIHCKLLNEICKNDNSISFVGVFDIDSEKNLRIAHEYNIKAFDSFPELLKEINTLIIVTPTTSHYEIAEEAIKRNVNLFIEKPVTSELDQAMRLLGKKNDLKIQIGHVERFNQALTSLEGIKINPRFIESHRLAQFNPRGTDVSVIQDLMIHDIDIILYLVKSPIKKIDANGVAILSEAIDIANARLQFENGCTANVTASRISLKKMRKMRIFQKNAYISLDFLNNKSEIFRLADISEIKDKSTTIPISKNKHLIFEQPAFNQNHNPVKNELESFFRSILNDTPVKVSLTEGKEALEVADKIIKIINEHQ